jgi:hypothetical protein
MNNEEYDDFEQVNVVSDEEPSNYPEIVSSKSKDAFPAIFALAIYLLIPLSIGMFISVVITQFFKGKGVYLFDILPIVMPICLILFFVLVFSSKPVESPEAKNENVVTLPPQRKKSKKKKLKKTSSQYTYEGLDAVEYANNIELAVSALKKLGIGNTYARSWVSRGLSAGIKSSDTQALVKFGLSGGASIHNGK